ncbi:hypothetical protein FQZ97_727980 [compost metagenome]
MRQRSNEQMLYIMLIRSFYLTHSIISYNAAELPPLIATPERPVNLPVFINPS